MRLRIGGSLALMMGLSCSAGEIPEGGRIGWKGKKDADVKALMEQARKQGKAMMLYFTSEG